MTRNVASGRVPTYALYGESSGPLALERIHCESIADRSRLHDWEIRPHRHDLFAQILHIRRGKGQALLDGTIWPMTGPCVVFVPPMVPHGFTFDSNVEGSVITIVAGELRQRLASAPQLLARLDVPHGRLLERGSDEAGLLEASLGALVGEFRGTAPWRAFAMEAALTLALFVTGRVLANPEGAAVVPRFESGHDGGSAGQGVDHAGGATLRTHRHIQRFIAAVDEGFRTPRSIAAYAEPLGITPAQLNRICRAQLGRSALQTVHARLLLEAERDLAYTSLSIKEIAITLGFGDAAYFTRFFNRQRGMSPSAYRHSARKQLAAAA